MNPTEPEKLLGDIQQEDTATTNFVDGEVLLQIPADWVGPHLGSNTVPGRVVAGSSAEASTWGTTCAMAQSARDASREVKSNGTSVSLVAFDRVGSWLGGDARRGAIKLVVWTSKELRRRQKRRQIPEKIPPGRYRRELR